MDGIHVTIYSSTMDPMGYICAIITTQCYAMYVLGQSGNLCRGHLLVPQTVCRWEVHDNTCHIFLLDESIVCGIDFSNTLQGHTCF